MSMWSPDINMLMSAKKKLEGPIAILDNEELLFQEKSKKKIKRKLNFNEGDPTENKKKIKKAKICSEIQKNEREKDGSDKKTKKNKKSKTERKAKTKKSAKKSENIEFITPEHAPKQYKTPPKKDIVAKNIDQNIISPAKLSPTIDSSIDKRTTPQKKSAKKSEIIEFITPEHAPEQYKTPPQKDIVAKNIDQNIISPAKLSPTIDSSTDKNTRPQKKSPNSTSNTDEEKVEKYKKIMEKMLIELKLNKVEISKKQMRNRKKRLFKKQMKQLQKLRKEEGALIPNTVLTESTSEKSLNQPKLRNTETPAPRPYQSEVPSTSGSQTATDPNNKQKYVPPHQKRPPTTTDILVDAIMLMPHTFKIAYMTDDARALSSRVPHVVQCFQLRQAGAGAVKGVGGAVCDAHRNKLAAGAADAAILDLDQLHAAGAAHPAHFREAHRILVLGGQLLIIGASSRIQLSRTFTWDVERVGFRLISLHASLRDHTLLQFVKMKAAPTLPTTPTKQKRPLKRER